MFSSFVRNKQIIALFLGPLLCFTIMSIPGGIAGLDPKGVKTLAACTWVLTWWVLELFPLAEVSLISIVIYGLIGVLPPIKGFTIMGNPNLMLMLGSMIILGAWKESNLISRYAYWSLSLGFIKGSPVRLLTMFCFAAGVVSSVMPNIPVVILFISIALEIAHSLNVGKDSKLIKTLCLVAGVAPTLGGGATPIGAAPNLIVMGAVAAALHYEVQFGEWTAIGLPVSVIMLVFSAILVKYQFGVRDTEGRYPQQIMVDKLKAFGPIKPFEHVAMASLGLAMVLWAFGNPLAALTGWPPAKALFAAPSVSLLMGVAILLTPMRRNKENGQLAFAMNWEQAIKSINWSIIVFMGGAILFGDVLVQGGVDKWIAGLIKNMLGNIPGLAVWFALMVIGSLLAQVVANIAVVGLFIPITANLAVAYGLEPVVTCLTVGMVCNIGIMFPFSSVPIAVAILESKDYAKLTDFMKYAFVILVLMCAVTMAVGLVVGPMVFPAGAGLPKVAS